MNILTVNVGSSSVCLGLFEKATKGLNQLDERHVKSDEEAVNLL